MECDEAVHPGHDGLMPHWTEGLSNVPGSVLQRLRNISRGTNQDMKVVLSRFATERLMYRISISRYSDNFILRGAWLFHVWGISRRATRDVDFLAKISNTANAVQEIFTEIVEVVVPHDDGLTFDPDSFQVHEIQLDAEYSGVRLRLIAMLGRTRIPTQVDLGFSEATLQDPVEVTLPVLLDFEAPETKAYSPEIVVAEKAEAIVKLGTITTRFKDFFDLFLLSNEKHFDGSDLVRQVRATFDHRGTTLPHEIPGGLSDGFGSDPSSQVQWQAFVRRSAAVDAPGKFGRVVGRVRAFIHPVLRAAKADSDPDLGQWDPDAGWTK
ncbi:MAG: nucleotidyl transferase AbiEii/AbiGii toxin family protein [Gemmatimonadales bacterium]|nr:MAG: nucleotidyl transferase AbiEii/AbiGii toxin family protein [Gemmatimonadales bacterium]